MATIRIFTGEVRQYAKQLEKAASPRATQLAVRAGVLEGALIYRKTLSHLLQSRTQLHPSKNKPRLKSRVRHRVLSQRRYAPNVYFEVGTYSTEGRQVENQPPAAVRLRFLEGTRDRWTGGRNDLKSFKEGVGAFRGRVKPEGIIEKMEAAAGARAFVAMETVTLAHLTDALTK